jgi:hypothetical protein
LVGKGKDFVRRHEMRAGLAGVLAEGAVAAVVPAKCGQWDENFLRKADEASLPPVTDLRGGREQSVERRRIRKKERRIAIDAPAFASAVERIFAGTAPCYGRCIWM